MVQLYYYWTSCSQMLIEHLSTILWTCFALVAALVILVNVSSRARYYFKFVYFIVVSLCASTALIPVMLLRPRDSRNALLPAWGLRVLSRFMGLHFTVRGHEHIVHGSGCVVLINHQSALDLIVLAQLWPILDRCTVISKKEVLYLGPFGLATWLWGTIFIDRLNPEKAQEAINTTGETIRARQARVLMFPEGTRHSGLHLLPFKKGAFHLAVAAQCPIQPVVVSNYYFLDDKTFKFDGGHAVITILPAIPTQGLAREQLPQLIEDTREKMAAAYTKLSAENNNK